MLEAWQFISERPELLVAWTFAHLRITFVAIAIAVPLGMLSISEMGHFSNLTPHDLTNAVYKLGAMGRNLRRSYS